MEVEDATIEEEERIDRSSELDKELELDERAKGEEIDYFSCNVVTMKTWVNDHQSSIAINEVQMNDDEPTVKVLMIKKEVVKADKINL